jgi:predicted acylesterase/phospholipase RssA
MSVKTEFARRVSVSCVDINTGDFTEFNQINTNYYDFGQAGLSSGSIPVVFPPQHFQGKICMDGGTVWNVNIDSAINQCHDMGATDDEITLDVLICGGPGMTPPQEEVSNSIQNF